MASEKIKDVKLEKYDNGSFVRTFKWNLPELIPDYSENSSGYLVQHIIRKTKDSQNKYSEKEDCNHSYWEAWPVNNGIIILDNSDFDDSWEWIHKGWHFTQPEAMIEIQMGYYNERRNTTGTIHMESEVYWAIEGSKLWNIVNDKFRKYAVPWAGDLICCREMEMKMEVE